MKNKKLIISIICVLVIAISVGTVIACSHSRNYSANEIHVKYNNEKSLYDVEIIKTEKHFYVSPQDVVIITNLIYYTSTTVHISQVTYEYKRGKLYCILTLR